MHAVVGAVGRVLAAPPDPVFAADRVGVRTPSAPTDLPAALVSLAIDDQRTLGVGGGTKWGSIVTQSSNIVEVGSTGAAFSPDLRRLRLSPLPLRPNPDSIGPVFGAEDVQVTNVTATDPATYRFATDPRAADEFAIDVARARLTFGASQKSGDKLAVVHWTVTSRDDIEVAVYRGRLTLEVWATTFTDLATTSAKLQERLAGRTLLRPAGFSKLEAAALQTAEHVLHDPAVASPFPIWRQALTYRFAFEYERPVQESGAGPIRRIDVEIDGGLDDALHIPAPMR